MLSWPALRERHRWPVLGALALALPILYACQRQKTWVMKENYGKFVELMRADEVHDMGHTQIIYHGLRHEWWLPDASIGWSGTWETEEYDAWLQAIGAEGRSSAIQMYLIDFLFIACYYYLLESLALLVKSKTSLSTALALATMRSLKAVVVFDCLEGTLGITACVLFEGKMPEVVQQAAPIVSLLKWVCLFVFLIGLAILLLKKTYLNPMAARSLSS